MKFIKYLKYLKDCYISDFKAILEVIDERDRLKKKDVVPKQEGENHE